MLLKPAILHLMKHNNLTEYECENVFKEILAFNCEKSNTSDLLQISAFLTLLRAKSETIEELMGIISVLNEKMIKLKTQSKTLDIVGTGGDSAGTINISTGSAILAASCGVKIAKHGNRAVSSLAGSADVLETLGVDIHLSPEKISACIEEVGIGFCYAPHFHPVMYQLKSLRQKLNVPTTFNLLGPLLNPTQPAHYLLGVYDESLLLTMAECLRKLSTVHSMVVYGNQLDELSCLGDSKIIEIKGSQIESNVLSPEKFGLSLCNIGSLKGGDAKKNAKLLLETFSGKEGAISDTLLLNSAVALYLYGLCSTVQQGIIESRNSLHQGKALEVLNKLIAFSKPFAAISLPMLSYRLNFLDQKKYHQNDFLKKIVEEKKLEVKRLKLMIKKQSNSRIAQILNGDLTFGYRKSLKKSLRSSSLSVIAEIKRRSPSKGKLAEIPHPVLLAGKYIHSGASTISVLTDQKYFDGNLMDLIQVSGYLRHTPYPVLRKDFIINELQIAESLSAGADAILCIVALTGKNTKQLLETSKRLNMEVIVEIHNAKERDIALNAGAEIIGINNRNLSSLQTNIANSQHYLNLIKDMPSSIIKIAESGIHHPRVAREFYQLGFDAVLIGEALVLSDSPEQFIKNCREEVNSV